MKDSKLGIILYTIGVAVIAIAIGFVLGRLIPDKEKSGMEERTETTTVKKSVSPAPAKEKQVGTISVPVSLELKDPDDPQLPPNEILLFVPESLKSGTRSDGYVPEAAKEGTYSNEAAPKDTIRAVIPLTQKEYSDSNFTAYVSGFHASLDSIEVKSKVITYTKTVTKFRAWNVGITGGYGYGFVSKRLEPFIGVGITLNLFR